MICIYEPIKIYRITNKLSSKQPVYLNKNISIMYSQNFDIKQAEKI